MKLNKNDMENLIKNAPCFKFDNELKIIKLDNGKYIIKWNDSRWKIDENMFVYEHFGLGYPKKMEQRKNYEKYTEMTIEKAYNLIKNRNLIKEHNNRLKFMEN